MRGGARAWSRGPGSRRYALDGPGSGQLAQGTDDQVLGEERVLHGVHAKAMGR